MEHCWNDTDRGKPKYAERNLPRLIDGDNFKMDPE
jgi:hypothetical protein